jgi:3-oxoacyl-[acyl-carrier-protein] synthase-3
MAASDLMGFRVTGWGTALPDKTVTNADLEARLDTSDEWIRERTGIRERRIGESTAALAIEAGRAALDRSGAGPGDVDLVVLCTTTPDQTMPATAAQVQHELGLGCGSMDLNAACAGAVYGLVTSAGLLTAGAQRVLLIGAETMSRMIDWEDRNTAVLFGDGAGALLLERTDASGGLRSWDVGTDGGARHLLYTDVGGYLQMDGKEVFRRAVRILIDSCARTVEQAGVSMADVALLVPHQANVRIVDAACQRLAFPADRVANVLATTGNTSAASIPLALVDALDHHRLQRGDLVLLSGFGAGMTWATALVEWDGPA